MSAPGSPANEVEATRVAERKPFVLRLDPATMGALRAWAGDDLRSLNGQIEYLLRRALRDAGRLPPSRPGEASTSGSTTRGASPNQGER